jgi:hypothetical protein
MISIVFLPANSNKKYTYSYLRADKAYHGNYAHVRFGFAEKFARALDPAGGLT